MIDATHRFHGRGSLRFVYQRGKTVRGPYGALRYIANTHRTDFRVAIVVSRKVHKSAVVRNRIRRRMYEAIRAETPLITKPYDMIFTVYSDQLATVDNAELIASVRKQLSGAGIIPSSDGPEPTQHDIVNAKE